MTLDANLPVNHKGTKCIHSDILCQEGYCTECQIYLNWLKEWEQKLGVNKQK